MDRELKNVGLNSVQTCKKAGVLFEAIILAGCRDTEVRDKNGNP
jgi:hypothetical protein